MVSWIEKLFKFKMETFDKDATLMDVEDCLTNVVGTFGRYQIFVCLTFSFYMLSSSGFIILPVFLAANITKLHEYNKRANNDSSILYEWDILDKPWIGDIIQALYFAGFLFGVVVLGQLSDKYGRKIVFQIGLFVLFPVYLVSSFSTSLEMFAAFRFLTGFFSGGLGLVTFVYVQENIGKKWWPLSSAIMGMFTPFGVLIFCLVAYLAPPWKKVILILSVLEIPVFIVALFMKESPRWLYSKNRIKEAEEVLVYIAKKNGVTDPVCNLKPLHLNSELCDKNYTLLDVIKNKITLKRLLILAYLWFVSCFVYFALTLAAGELYSNVYISEALIGFVDIPVQLVYPWIINHKWSGRKRATVVTLFLSGIFCWSLSPFTPEDTSNAKMALGLLGKMSVSFSFGILYVYSPELFPTYVRNVAMGSVSMCARVGGILSSFAESVIQMHSVLAYVVFGFCAVSAGLLALFLPETLGTKPPNSFEDIQTQPQLLVNDVIISSSKRNVDEKTPLLRENPPI